MGAEQPEPGILPILPEAVDRFSGPVVRNGVSDEDVFRLDVPVAFLNGFMARFPGVGMVPVLGFRFQGGWQGLRLLPIQPESGETTNREGVFSWKRSFQLVLCKQERPGLRLSIFFFHSAPLTVKNGIMLHGRELLKLSCFPRRKTARRVENCWKRSGGNCLSALRLPEGPGNIWQERACPRLHIPVAGLVRPGRFLPGCPRPPVPGARVPGRGPFPRRGIAPFWC